LKTAPKEAEAQIKDAPMQKIRLPGKFIISRKYAASSLAKSSTIS